MMGEWQGWKRQYHTDEGSKCCLGVFGLCRQQTRCSIAYNYSEATTSPLVEVMCDGDEVKLATGTDGKEVDQALSHR
jgi:hypothetical protein